MGEKYDDCYEYELRPRLSFSQESLERLRDPSQVGFPPANYDVIRQWGAPGREALGSYLQRPASTIAEITAEATTRLEQAGSDPAAQLSAGRDIVEKFTAGYEQIRMQTDEGNRTLQMLDREGTIPTPELADTARESARAWKQAVTDHVGPFEAAANAVFGIAKGKAFDAMGAQIEAGINQVSALAYRNMANLHRGMFRRGLADVPEAG